MPIPGVQDALLPILEYCIDGEIKNSAQIYSAMSEHFNATEEELRRLLPSGKQQVFRNRIAWAKAFLKQAKLIDSPDRGMYIITGRGKAVLSENPPALDIKYLSKFDEFAEFRKKAKKENASQACEEQGEKTPRELVEDGIASIRAELANNILDTVKKCSAVFFERLVVDLLIKMGYGGSRKEAGLVTSYTVDEGIDGIIKEDKLGLDVIYIQAKKWESVVSRPEIQKFAGALLGKRAKKGVFITTSSFSKEACIFTNSIESNIVLIDGKKLADYMIEYNVGVAVADIYEVKKIDFEYFSEENT